MVNKKITSIDDLSVKDITLIAEQAIKFQNSKKLNLVKKPKNIFNLFLEPSTRTTISFELAAKNSIKDLAKQLEKRKASFSKH